MEIKRDAYLDQLKIRKDNGMVKIITGIRRCGKSFLLFVLFKKYLSESGIDNDHIIEIALDGIENDELRDSKEVDNMCVVAKGPNHGPAPIPEEGKWIQAKEIKDISGYTHGVGWCAPQQGACKLSLNIKEGVILDAILVEMLLDVLLYLIAGNLGSSLCQKVVGGEKNSRL